MTRMTIKRLGVLSVAKVQALLMGFFGLIIGVIYGLIFMVFGAAMLTQGGRGGSGAAAGGVAVGLILMVAIPVFYAVIGFIGGALGAAIYNLAAGVIGGIEMELESATQGYDAPPPPQWGASPYQPGQQAPPY